MKYCKLRIETYEYFVKSIKENTTQYQPKIDSLNKKIEGLIDSIKKNE